MSAYNTRQKAEVADFFQVHSEECFTPDEVASALPCIPLSTVYRTLSHLEAEGTLRRAGTAGRAVLYQYQGEGCPEHMHIRCSLCGRSAHLDSEANAEIWKAVERATGFTPLNTTVFEGICPECRRKGK